MNLLLISRVQANLSIPNLGEAFRLHIEEKKHPAVRASSLTAWNLLLHGLKLLELPMHPSVAFSADGKPHFAELDHHFSLSHSGDWASALLSPAPCAVDLEHLRPEIQTRLTPRCLSDAEKQAGMDFFEAWTKKECIVKLNGRGWTAHPNQIDTLQSQFEGCFFTRRIQPGADAYVLSALCMDGQAPIFKQIEPETLFP